MCGAALSAQWFGIGSAFEMSSWFPELPLPAIAAGHQSPLPQFGSNTFSIDGACDLGKVCTATGQDTEQIQKRTQ